MSSTCFHGFFDLVERRLGLYLTKVGEDVDVGQWQSLDVSDKPLLVTRELRRVNLCIKMGQTVEDQQRYIRPNLPWAEDHFLERVSSDPLNPPPSHAWWPYRQRGNEDHIQGGVFSHTYPERYWPKRAGEPEDMCSDWDTHRGIRYFYGDLGDLVEMLRRTPLTRQAYLPVWFPEDTGAVEGQRVPCSLGYHFLIRNGELSVDYSIRSCDFLRHFRDDVYMTQRLALWVAESTGLDLRLGDLDMHIGSLHVFAGDKTKMERVYG